MKKQHNTYKYFDSRFEKDFFTVNFNSLINISKNDGYCCCCCDC